MCRGPPLGCVCQQRLRLKTLDATFDSFGESDWWSVWTKVESMDISGEDAHGRRGSGPGWQEEAVGEAGGREGKMGERGTVACKGDWAKPCQEGRFPLAMIANFVISLKFLRLHNSC